MRIIVFASGSSGNCTFVELGNHRLLIDVGLSCRRITGYLQKYGIELGSLEAVLLTHTHSDHIQGLKTFVKTYSKLTAGCLPLMLSHSTWQHIQYTCEASEKVREYVFEKFDTPMVAPWPNGLAVIPLSCRHDVPCNGFLLQSAEASIVYMTDTGLVEGRYLQSLKNKEFYIFESNYDEEILSCCFYSNTTKRRIDSATGHLSNEASARYLSELVGKDTRKVVLAHISANSNNPNVALQIHRNVLRDCPFNVDNIVCASRTEDIVVV